MSVEIIHRDEDGSVRVETYDGRYGLMGVETYDTDTDYYLADCGDGRTSEMTAPTEAATPTTANVKHMGGGVDIL